MREHPGIQLAPASLLETPPPSARKTWVGLHGEQLKNISWTPWREQAQQVCATRFFDVCECGTGRAPLCTSGTLCRARPLPGLHRLLTPSRLHPLIDFPFRISVF